MLYYRHVVMKRVMCSGEQGNCGGSSFKLLCSFLLVFCILTLCFNGLKIIVL